MQAAMVGGVDIALAGNAVLQDFRGAHMRILQHGYVANSTSLGKMCATQLLLRTSMAAWQCISGYQGG